MKHLGDIKTIRGDVIEPVDCITFGSPCQDLSIAGKRAGMAGERSGLFMEAVRIIKEMREATNGMYPAFAVWENVPGAFSSNKGEDFRAVLEELVKIVEPEAPALPAPGKNGGPYADCIMGDGWSIAWRVLDAQYWGVPQRRRRIALVLDLGGGRAGEILFERAGLSGDPEPCIPAWKGIARDPADGAGRNDRMVGAESYTLKIRSGCKGGGKGALVQTEKSDTLSTLQDQTLFVLQGNMIDREVRQNGAGTAQSETMFTLNATDRHGVCCAAFTAGQGAKANGIGWAEEQAPTLRTDGGLSAMPTVLCRAHGQANAEVLEDQAPTLSCNHEQPIVFESHSQDARYTQQVTTSPACTAQWGTGGNNMPLVAEKCHTPWDSEARRVYSEDGCFPALTSRERTGQNQQAVLLKMAFRWIVRRLTPVECERLQGYPDGWTDIGEWRDSKGKKHKPADSPRYKALGNSIALPQWWWLVCKMANHLPDGAKLGSLFDGIGGFPLVWETRHGKGTARWASEIEPYCIAVTKYHFGED